MAEAFLPPGGVKRCATMGGTVGRCDRNAETITLSRRCTGPTRAALAMQRGYLLKDGHRRVLPCELSWTTRLSNQRSGWNLRQGIPEQGNSIFDAVDGPCVHPSARRCPRPDIVNLNDLFGPQRCRHQFDQGDPTQPSASSAQTDRGQHGRTSS